MTPVGFCRAPSVRGRWVRGAAEATIDKVGPFADDAAELFSWAWQFEPLIFEEGYEFERVATRDEARSLIASWDVDWCPDALVECAERYLFTEADWRLPARKYRRRNLRRRPALVRDRWLLNAGIPIKLHTIETALDLARDLDQQGHGRRSEIVSLAWMQAALAEAGLVVGLAARSGALEVCRDAFAQRRSAVRALRGTDLTTAIFDAFRRSDVGSLDPHDQLDLRELYVGLAQTPDCLAVFGADLVVHNVAVPLDPWSSIPR